MQNPYTIKVKESAKNMCTSRSDRSGDTIYTRPCTNANADGAPKLQHLRHYIYCTKLTVKGHQDHTD